MKNEFIHNEVWTLTFGGAFQRASVYQDDKIGDEAKNSFKAGLRKHIEGLIPEYMDAVDEARHLENIHSVGRASQRHAYILNHGRLNFGVSQKLLNLYLKYRWCLGHIHEPPHFPLDRRIQEILSIPVKSWTQLDDQAEYLKIVRQVRKKAEAANMSLAEYELNFFERRNRTTP